MAQYVVDFEWTKTLDSDEPVRRLLIANDAEGAKLEAALLFAVGDFRGVDPTGYRVVNESDGKELCRFRG